MSASATTESATKRYGRTAYYQVIVWIGKDEDMNVMELGLEHAGDYFLPTYVTINSAPKHILKSMHCTRYSSYQTLGYYCIRLEGPVCFHG